MNMITSLTQRLGDNEAALIVVDEIDGVSYAIDSAALIDGVANEIVARQPSTLRAVWVIRGSSLINYTTDADRVGLPVGERVSTR